MFAKDEKLTTNEIWKEAPEPDFPQCILDKLDLKELH